MPIDRDVLDAVRDMDEHDLRRLMILARARLEQHGVSFAEDGPRVNLRQQWVRCGKASCTKCPHGPYWYAHWREDGRRRSRYVGKLETGDSSPGAQDADRVGSGDRGGRE